MGIINQGAQEINDSVARGEHETTSWGDIIIPASGMTRNTEPPTDKTFLGWVEAPAFSGTGTGLLSGSFEMPHDYKEGTTLRPHVHWSPSDTGTGTVKWLFEYTIANPGDVFASFPKFQAGPSTNGITREHITSELGTIDGTGLKIGCMILFKLCRDGADQNDTYNSDIFLHSLGMHYEQDGDGSRDILTKGV